MKVRLVPNARKLWRAWSVQMAAVGAVLPELMQLVADNSDALPWFDQGDKDALRLGCLVLIPVLRAVQQGGEPIDRAAP